MERLLKYLVCLQLFLFSGVKAFIYDVCVMRKWNPAYRNYCYFVGLGDFHDKCHSITPLQIKQINDIIYKCPGDTNIIVEDISSKNKEGCRSCANFFIKSKGGILGGFTKKCLANGIRSIENVEYRFCRVASLAPILNNIHKNARSFSSACKIRVDCLKNEIENICRKISSYKDGAVLDAWYEKCIDKVSKCMKSLKWDKAKNLSVADYICCYTKPKNRLNIVKKLLTFDSYLLDTRIIHSMMNNNKNKRNTIVIAGGSHIRNVSRILQRLGFETVYKNKPLFKREYDMKKCLGCHIQPGGFCRKPEPADLKVLENFL